MKRKFLSMALAAVLATTMLNVPVTAYADAGTSKVEDMADEQTPDDLVSGNETIGEEQSIDVTSKEVGNEHKIIYSVEISWGAMNFEYNYGSVWDPATHSYSSGEKEGSWKTSCLNGTNNKISVENNSNYPVTVDLSFKKEDGRFNVGNSGTAVRGVFSDDNENLKNNINGDSVEKCGKTGIISVDLATDDKEGRYTVKGKSDAASLNGGNGANTSMTRYFGLWGTHNKGQAKSEGAKAGTITVSVKPYHQK